MFTEQWETVTVHTPTASIVTFHHKNITNKDC